MPKNPYHTSDNKPVLQWSVFVFMDILGYSEMIRKAERDGTQQENLEKLYKALETGRSWLEEKGLTFGQSGENNDYALKAFTDNIVIGWPVRDDAESEFGRAFYKLLNFQFYMVLEGFFVRGALTLNNIYLDEIAVFGSALTETYEAEVKLARDPRIILTNSAVSAVKKHLSYYSQPHGAPHTRVLLKDSDGQWFLNYLDCVLSAVDEHGPFYEELVRHKNIVEQQLIINKGEPQIWAKYSWVASYHNYFCDSHPTYFGDEHKIDLELFRASPSPIVDMNA